MRDRLTLWLDRLPLKTIDRYLMRQFLISYGVVATSAFGLFIVIEGVTRLDHFLKQDAFLLTVLLSYFSAMIPVYFAQYLGPVLTLTAAMFTLTLLNKGSEIIPLKAAGLSIQRVLASFFVLAFGFALAMIVVQEALLPNIKEQIRNAQSYADKKTGIRDVNIPDSLGQLISVKKYYPKRFKGEAVVVKKLSEKVGTVTEIIRAAEIVWKGDYWVLYHGQILRWDESTEKYIIQDGKMERTFNQYILETSMRPEDLEATDREINFLSHRELSLQIKRHEHLKHIEVKLHRRYAFPMANVILLLLGLPLVLRGENQSVVLGVGAAMAVSAIYLFSDAVCADLGNQGALPPMLAAWLPVLFFGALGLTLFDGMES